MEYLDLYDVNKNLTGKKIVRGKGKPQVPENKYINIVIIFMQNSEGKFLFQITSKEKGNEIATTGGHVKSGQTSYEAILAEVNEELGLDISKEDVKMIDSYIFGVAFMDVYYLNKDINISDLKLQDDEVESVEWFTIDRIKELINEGKVRKGNIKAFESILNYLNNN